MLRSGVGVWDDEPMLAGTAEPFAGEGWVFEIKYDGFRMLAGRDRGRPRLRYRSGLDATGAFPEVAAALDALPRGDFVLDGEVVVLDAEGRPRFQRLQQRSQATLFAFDCLAAEGRDLRARPLLERKEALRRILRGQSAIRFVDHVATDGLGFFAEVRALGLEGIVAKRADSAYVPGRSRDWRKIRFERTGDFVVVGYTRIALGEEGGLHLAAADAGILHYAGRVGTGFEAGVLAEARALLAPFVRDTAACEGAPRTRGHVWVEPRIVCEVRYKERTDAGLLRHPVFVRFRRSSATRS